MSTNSFRDSRRHAHFLSCPLPDPDALEFLFAYIEQPTDIITRQESASGCSLESLQGKTVAVLQRSGVRQYLEKLQGKRLEILPVHGTPASVLEAVLLGDAEAALLDLTVATFFLKRTPFTNLKIAGYTNYIAVRGIAVRKDMPKLRQKLLTIISDISPDEHAALREK